MRFSKNSSFLLINLIFTVSYLLIAFPHIPLVDVKLKVFSIVLLALNSLLLFFPRKLRAFFMFIIIGLISIYFGMQTVYFRGFQQYGSITTAVSIDTSMFKFTNSALDLLNIYDIRYFIVPFIAYYLALKWINKGIIQKNVINQFIVLVLTIFLAYAQYQSFHNDLNSSISTPAKIYDKAIIYSNIPNINNFVETFGLNGLLMREFDINIKEIELQPEYTIEQQISQMFSLKTSPQKSEFSGIFKGKNLLLIQAESLNNFVIDEVLTPTLYRLKTKGIFVEGYNSPLLIGSTSDSEFMTNTSLLPANNGKITSNVYYDNTFPNALAKVFTKSGYYSMATHNNYGVYYNRDVMMPKLGYDFFDSNRIKAEDTVADSYVIDYIKWIMYEQEHYFSYWITYTSHQPYGKDTLNEQQLGYYELVENRFPDVDEEVKVYYAKVMDLDRGLKQLLIDYKNSNILDDLVIMIYGDHFPKGIFENKEDYRELCEGRGINFETCFKTPFIIWSNDEHAQVIEKISSTLDISPTIYDLFDLEYDYRWTLGNSVFDPSYDGFLFDEYSVIYTDNFIYDSLRNSVVHNWTKSEEAFKIEAHNLFDKLNLGFKIVETDYFNSLEFKKGK